MKKNIRGDDDHYPNTGLICVENTHNMCGGRVVPQDWIDEVLSCFSLSTIHNLFFKRKAFNYGF